MNQVYGTFMFCATLNLTVYQGERIVVCGPSGSGKSTLTIRCINALEEHQEGLDRGGWHAALFDLKKHLIKFAPRLGCLPELSILFPTLTILET